MAEVTLERRPPATANATAAHLVSLGLASHLPLTPRYNQQGLFFPIEALKVFVHKQCH